MLSAALTRGYSNYPSQSSVNNAISISTGFTPFYLNTGAHPTTLVSMMHGGASKGSQNEAVKETLERMKTALAEAQTNLEHAQCRMANVVNCSRRSEQYNIGDEVVLSTMNLRNYCAHLPAKLRARWVGLFTISRVVSPVAYKVDLPLGWQIHLVFHIDRLKRYIRSEESLREVEKPPPVLMEDHLEYEVEGLIRHRGRGVPRQCLVLWKGYPFTEATWEYERDLKNAPDILEAYLRRCGERTRERRRS